MITNETLNKRYKVIITIVGILSILFIYFLFFYKPNYYKDKAYLGNKVKEQKITTNTLRIDGRDLYETCASVSQIAYPATFQENRPNGVILVRDDKIEDGMLAPRISHDPINAPILFTKKESIPESTLKEIERLHPRGVFVDSNIKIILVGDIGEGVKNILKEKGLTYRHIKGKDVYDLSFNVDNYLAAIYGDHKDAVIIAPVEKPQYALSQTAWNAHKGDGFFFVEKYKVPERVKDALKARYGGAYIYLLGSDLDISNEVKRELAKYGHVQRISNGEDIYSQSASFASYKDVGKNFSWWLSKRPRDFGWGITEAGHNFIFVNPRNWQIAITSSILSHKGNHGPMLLVYKNNIPYGVVNYLKSVKPIYNSSQEVLSNRGFIIGDSDSISDLLQIDIDNMLHSERGGR